MCCAGLSLHLNEGYNEDGGAGFYRFPALGPDEGERCQFGPRHLTAATSYVHPMDGHHLYRQVE